MLAWRGVAQHLNLGVKCACMYEYVRWHNHNINNINKNSHMLSSRDNNTNWKSKEVCSFMESQAGMLNDNNSIQQSKSNERKQDTKALISIEAFYGHWNHFQLEHFFCAPSKIGHGLWYRSSYTRQFVVVGVTLPCHVAQADVPSYVNWTKAYCLSANSAHIRIRHCTGIKRCGCVFVTLEWRLLCRPRYGFVWTHALANTKWVCVKERADVIGVYKLFNVKRLSFSSCVPQLQTSSISFALVHLPIHLVVFTFPIWLAFDAQLLHMLYGSALACAHRQNGQPS